MHPHGAVYDSAERHVRRAAFWPIRCLAERMQFHGSRARAGVTKAGVRGSTLVEFALVALFFFLTAFTIFTFSFFVFTKAALGNAVREGARYGITGQTAPSMGQDASIQQVVMDNALGLLNGQSGLITIQYYAADGSGATTSNAAGNILVVSVNNYPLIPLAQVWSSPLSVSVSAVEKVEPFPGAPPPRTLP